MMVEILSPTLTQLSEGFEESEKWAFVVQMESS